MLYLIKQQPFMDRLMIRNVCLPLSLNLIRIDIELQGYADDLDALIGSDNQHQILTEEWSL